jgi:AcrR family transcriptional regulator
VRPSALYRHFASKEQLLEEILRQGLASLEAAVAALDLTAGPPGLSGLALSVIESRSTGALLGRERPHLSDGPRAGLRAGLVAVAGLLAAKIAAARPELPPHAADFLSWATLAVLQSPAYHHGELPLADQCADLAELSWRVISAPLPADLSGQPARPPAAGLLPWSRREALLTRAVALFAERTYASVSIDDIGATLGITGASVYNHFPSKSGILVTALARGSACLSMQVADTLAGSAGAGPALAALVSSYAGFAAAHPALIDLMISEVRSLPEPDREATLTAQRDYIAELAQLLRQVHPALPAGRARVHVQAALMIANDVARTPHLRDQAGSTAAVAVLCDQVLDLPESPETLCHGV